MEDMSLHDVDEIIEGSDEEGEAMTAAHVLSKIEQLWVTEKLSPTLECHQGELVDCLLDQLTQMEENLKRCEENDFRLSVHKMELQRVRFVLCSYLRCRLRKVERFSHQLLEEHGKLTDERHARLTNQELEFAKEYSDSIEDHFNTLALQHINHPKLRQFDAEKMSVKANIDAYVFLKVNKETAGIMVEDPKGTGDELVDLKQGGQYLMPYRSVQHMLEAGDVSLM